MHALTPDQTSIRSAPVVETERLVMRGHRLDDFEPAAVMWGSASVTRHVGGRPFTREEVWARIMRYAGHWSLLGFGYWALEDKASGQFVGEAGFADFKRDMDPPLGDAPELGWVLVPDAQGRGLATEAARAAAAWGDGHFGPVRTFALIHPDNLASIRVARKVGFVETRATTYKGHPTLVFER